MTPTKLHKQSCSVCASPLGYTLHDSPEPSFCEVCIYAVECFCWNFKIPTNNPLAAKFLAGRYNADDPLGENWLESLSGATVGHVRMVALMREYKGQGPHLYSDQKYPPYFHYERK